MLSHKTIVMNIKLNNRAKRLQQCNRQLCVQCMLKPYYILKVIFKNKSHLYK